MHSSLRDRREVLMIDPARFGLHYRIIYSIEKQTVTVHVIKTGRRKEVYED
jgi:hypothetical protein